MADLGEQKFDSLRYMYQLCYRVIEQAQNNYRKNLVSERMNEDYIFIAGRFSLFCKKRDKNQSPLTVPGKPDRN